jgi:hypothetical protein
MGIRQQRERIVPDGYGVRIDVDHYSDAHPNVSSRWH